VFGASGIAIWGLIGYWDLAIEHLARARSGTLACFRSCRAKWGRARIVIPWQNNDYDYLSPCIEQPARTGIRVANGADVNAKDGGGETPRDKAAAANHPSLAKLLEEHGTK